MLASVARDLMLTGGRRSFEGVDDRACRNHVHAPRQSADHIEAQTVRIIVDLAVAERHGP